MFQIIKNTYSALNNSGSIDAVDMNKLGDTPKKKALYGIFKTVTFFCIVALVYIVFARPNHCLDLKIAYNFKANDVPIPEEFLYKTPTLISSWYEAEDYESVVRFAERNAIRKDHYEGVLVALSYLKANDLSGAIERFDEIAVNKDNPYCNYAEYKKAYIYVLLKDIRGIDILNSIIENPKHPYCRGAVMFIKSDVCKVLLMEKGGKSFS